MPAGVKNIPVYYDDEIPLTTVKRSDDADVVFVEMGEAGAAYVGYIDVGGTFTHSGETKRGYYATVSIFKSDGSVVDVSNAEDKSLSYTVTDDDVAICLSDGEN